MLALFCAGFVIGAVINLLISDRYVPNAVIADGLIFGCGFVVVAALCASIF